MPAFGGPSGDGGERALDAPTHDPPTHGEPDRIGAALGALGAGAAGGAALVAGALAVLRHALENALPLILFAGIVAAVTIGWSAATVIEDTWRRAVTATLAAFGAVMLAGLSAPADMAGGRLGLGVYAVLLGIASAMALAKARRASAA